MLHPHRLPFLRSLVFNAAAVFVFGVIGGQLDLLENGGGQGMELTQLLVDALSTSATNRKLQVLDRFPTFLTLRPS